MIYLDNAATSWPKPPEVLKAMTHILEQAGGNPGRSGHALSIDAARVMYDTREALAGFFHGPDPQRVVFTANVTHAINIVLRGLLKPGDRVVTTGMEHNAVMRPLRHLESSGVIVDVIPCDRAGRLDMVEMENALQRETRLVVVNHASNVTGTILPVADIAPLARRAGALLLVDAAQTAGVLPIDMPAMGIDILAFTGHKGLLGPPGTGGMLLGDNVDTGQLEPLVRGGTGSLSEREEQPEYLPDKYESGTPNIVGIAGLGAGLEWIIRKGVDAIREYEMELAGRLLDGLRGIPGITRHGTLAPADSTAIVSFTAESRTVSEIGLTLDEEHGIMTRVGLHCAPAAHRTIGTFPEGTVRLAPGIFTSREDIELTVEAIERVVNP
ncbi:MAG: aminotransferase class V-fold PLP-dependent enzyme [Dehalococcoidales bacterium]|nr:aminotransferase class V-fold PLP-dependent enzyme [Dehalococcoidales bacterium]